VVVESCSIIIVILLMSFVFFRTRKKTYAVAIIPLTFIPVLNLLSKYIYFLVSSVFAIDVLNYNIILYLVGLLISSIMFGAMSVKMKSNAARRSYIGVCSIFTLVLTLIFLFRSIQ